MGSLARTAAPLAALSALLVSLAAGQPAPTLQVIVNATNPIVSLSREQVADLFLKRVTRWSDGTPVAPVDHSAASILRAAFCREVIGRPLSAVKAYWEERVFSGRAAPPEIKATSEAVVAFVEANPGAIGYVPTGVMLPGGVKALTLTQEKITLR